jgi:phage shock protein A
MNDRAPSPIGAASAQTQNGSFETNAIGSSSVSSWKTIGNAYVAHFFKGRNPSVSYKRNHAMNLSAYRSFLGVVLGFTSVLLLFVKCHPRKPIDDAKTLLQQAQQQMREAQARNRERAVAAITAKNNLQAQVDQTKRMIGNLQAKAQKAHDVGDLDLERQLTTEQSHYEHTLQTMAVGLQNAIETTEAVKTAMRREEDRIRAQTAQALAMEAQYKQAQVEWEIEKSRLGMTTSYASELFERAQAKIQQAQAKRDLTAQIRTTVEAMEAGAEAAASVGDETLRQRLLSERDHIKKAALNPRLWQ